MVIIDIKHDHFVDHLDLDNNDIKNKLHIPKFSTCKLRSHQNNCYAPLTHGCKGIKVLYKTFFPVPCALIKII